MICDECETVAHCLKNGCVPKHQALDRMAENARELGLDYEPAPVQDSTCSETLRAQGKAYPRTCRKCGKGPCIGAPKQLPEQPAPMLKETK
jgi:hypothetical protein